MCVEGGRRREDMVGVRMCTVCVCAFCKCMCMCMCVHACEEGGGDVCMSNIYSTGGGSRDDRGGGNPPSKKVFIRNLSRDTDRYALEDVFPDATDIHLPKDRDTGETRG